jgi:ankyrin repeat protein
MNEKLAGYMKGFENKYPHSLEARYGRVLEKIVELWGTPAIDGYFSELMLPDRIDRQGFPPEVASEIFELSVAYDEILKRAKDNDEDVWNIDHRAAKEEIEDLGWQFSANSLLKSVESGNYDLCLLFLKAGMPVDMRDGREWTPLMVAAFNGHEDMAALLIKHGANVHAQDFGGYTPLHWAAFNGYGGVTTLLINRGADPNAKSKYGLTALLQAAARGHTNVAEVLLDAGANPNIATDDGGTPLHKAVANGHAEIVLRLLQAGASRFARHRNGSTPFSLAQKGKYPEILKMIRAANVAAADGNSESPGASA